MLQVQLVVLGDVCLGVLLVVESGFSVIVGVVLLDVSNVIDSYSDVGWILLVVESGFSVLVGVVQLEVSHVMDSCSNVGWIHSPAPQRVGPERQRDLPSVTRVCFSLNWSFAGCCQEQDSAFLQIFY